MTALQVVLKGQTMFITSDPATASAKAAELGGSVEYIGDYHTEDRDCEQERKDAEKTKAKDDKK